MTTKLDCPYQQPPVLKLACFTAAFERFGFYVLTFLVTLYAKTAFGYSDQVAFAIFSIFTALSFITPVLGGYLADNVFGIRNCMIIGLVFEGSGLALLAIPKLTCFYLALALVIVGGGFFRTCPTHLLGRSYTENDPRIDSGFTLYYMGMNIGPLITALGIGLIQRYFGWPAAFITGGIAVFCGLGAYFFYRHTAVAIDAEVSNHGLSLGKIGLLVLGIGVAVLLATYLMAHANIGQLVIVGCSLAIFAYFSYEIVVAPKEEKLKIIVCLALIFTGLVFFVMYLQLFTSLTLFVNRCVDRKIFGFEIPTVAYFSLNCSYVIVISYVLAKVYKFLGKHNRDLAVTSKFSLGLLISAATFFVLLIGIKTTHGGQVSSWWIVIAYFLMSIGEVLVNALGVAMVTRIAPKRLYGIMMGTWFLVGMSLAAWIANLLANLASVPSSITDPGQIMQIYQRAFLIVGAISLVCAVVSSVTGPYLRRIAKF